MESGGDLPEYTAYTRTVPELFVSKGRREPSLPSPSSTVSALTRRSTHVLTLHMHTRVGLVRECLTFYPRQQRHKHFWAQQRERDRCEQENDFRLRKLWEQQLQAERVPGAWGGPLDGRARKATPRARRVVTQAQRRQRPSSARPASANGGAVAGRQASGDSVGMRPLSARPGAVAALRPTPPRQAQGAGAKAARLAKAPTAAKTATERSRGNAGAVGLSGAARSASQPLSLWSEQARAGGCVCWGCVRWRKIGQAVRIFGVYLLFI
jgi:hypothetical protein